MFSNPKIKRTSLIQYDKSIMTNGFFIGKRSYLLDRIIGGRSCNQQDIDIFISSFHSKFNIFPIKICISILCIDDIISLFEQQLFRLFQKMRIRSIEDYIHIPFSTILLDIRQKIRTEIRSVEIVQSFLMS